MKNKCKWLIVCACGSCPSIASWFCFVLFFVYHCAFVAVWSMRFVNVWYAHSHTRIHKHAFKTMWLVVKNIIFLHCCCCFCLNPLSFSCRVFPLTLHIECIVGLNKKKDLVQTNEPNAKIKSSSVNNNKKRFMANNNQPSKEIFKKSRALAHTHTVLLVIVSLFFQWTSFNSYDDDDDGDEIGNTSWEIYL